MKPRALNLSSLQARYVASDRPAPNRQPADVDKLRRDMARWHQDQRDRRAAQGIEEPPGERLDLLALRRGKYGRGK